MIEISKQVIHKGKIQYLDIFTYNILNAYSLAICVLQVFVTRRQPKQSVVLLNAKDVVEFISILLFVLQ